jgi:L-fuculose-phosphate aldolase
MSIPEDICKIGKLMFDRFHTDSAGGNISVRAEDGTVYMTPRYTGAKYHWNLKPEQIEHFDPETVSEDVLENRLSRETRMHLACLAAFEDANCVIHAHPKYILAFACTGTPMPVIYEQTQKFGEIGFCEAAPSHTPDLPPNVVAALEPMADQIAKHPIAVMLPTHGIALVGANILTTYDALERLHGNAESYLLSRLLV